MVIPPRWLLLLTLGSALNAGVALAAPVFFPARVGGDGAVRRVAIESDCRVHVELKDGAETLHPCGARVVLPAEGLLVWIEQSEDVSGQIAPPADEATVDMPLAPAGAVRVESEGVSSDEQRTVRILNFGSVPFARTIRVGKSGRHLLMPQGRTEA